MRRLVVLTGAAGAGKTSIAAELDRLGEASLLKTFVAGSRDRAADQECLALERRPGASRVAWSGEYGGTQYGMLKSELDRVPTGGIGLTVIDPIGLSDLEQFRRERRDFEVVIVGLDTIPDFSVQLRRVGDDVARAGTAERLAKIREHLATVDIRLTASEIEVIEAVRAVCRILQARGGMLTNDLLSPLIAAGAVLTSADAVLLKSASYDLRVGDEVWCAGFKDLTPNEPLFEIPPYSYAIVKAMERAALPTFMTAQFDLRVSFFLSGIILSNGPQVDPGYRGDLFCMLFNGNSEPHRMRMGDRFCTIQFITTARVGQPYDGEYSIRDKLRRSMPANAAVGPGGAIFSKLSSDIEAAKKELRGEFPKDRANIFLGLISILAGISIAISLWTASVALDAGKATSEANKAASNARSAAGSAREDADAGGPEIGNGGDRSSVRKKAEAQVTRKRRSAESRDPTRED